MQRFTATSYKLAYHQDPLSLFAHLTKDMPNSLLLESAEIQSKDSLKSLLILQPALTITCLKNKLTFIANAENGLAVISLLERHFNTKAIGNSLIVDIKSNNVMMLDESTKLTQLSVFDGLRILLNNLVSSTSESIFLGGIFGYDLIASFEPIPEVALGDNICPDYLFYLAESIISLDHQQKSAVLTQYNFSQTDSTKDNLSEIAKQIINDTKLNLPPIKSTPMNKEAIPNINDNEFADIVTKIRSNICKGDVFQAVPSRTFAIECHNSFGAYQVLKTNNPSPYMFYLKHPDFTLFGASPESAVKYTAATRQVEIYPIAGTRHRGVDENGNINIELDTKIELDLRLDQKELAEHIMLVDLARNDIARICKTGTREIKKLLTVDHYSHVMHLISLVVGELDDKLDALHAYQACMNMGTLVGAPKVKAAQLISLNEQKRRGSYGGAVGYLNGNGDMDTCIVIRSAFIRNGIAYIQAGAGVVFDSNPIDETMETRQKAQAVINAINLGGGL